MKYGIIFAIISVVSILYIKLAIRYNIIDSPNKRSSHTVPTIQGGGILFLVALWLFFVFSKFQYPYLVFGVTLIAAVSFIDDVKTLSSKLRLPFQFIAIFLVLFDIGLPFSPVYVFVLTMIIGVGFINLYNFMDGINGVTGCYSLGVLFGLYIVNTETNTIDPDLIICLFISIVVFGYYNFRKKARFFSGDIGSISIGVILFFMIISFMNNLLAPVFVLWVAVYGIDGGLTILYRLIKNENIMQPHRLHIYQKLVDSYKISHLNIAFSYAILQFFLGWLVYKTYKLSFLCQVSIVFVVFIFLFALYVFLFYKTKEKVSK